MTQSTLDARLAAAAEYVRQGAVFADIGTDHAHLPIYLLECGRITQAIAADIAQGPLSRAQENASEHGLSDKIIFRLTDGLCGLDSLGITDVAICGMGGELISQIIDSAQFLRDTKIRLILQPMSKQENLRAYLSKNGFRIISERVSLAQGKLYSCICAEYDGTPYELELGELYVGRPELKNENDRTLYCALIDKKCASLEKRLLGTGNTDRQAALALSQLERMKKDADENL